MTPGISERAFVPAEVITPPTVSRAPVDQPLEMLNGVERKRAVPEHWGRSSPCTGDWPCRSLSPSADHELPDLMTGSDGEAAEIHAGRSDAGVPGMFPASGGRAAREDGSHAAALDVEDGEITVPGGGQTHANGEAGVTRRRRYDQRWPRFRDHRLHRGLVGRAAGAEAGQRISSAGGKPDVAVTRAVCRGARASATQQMRGYPLSQQGLQ